jgi:drug/metabolite transporter (DMT)-like permease
MLVLDSESTITTHGTACLRTPIITALALIAFAANSIICRMALGEGSIDPASFTTIRIISGAVALFFIVRITRKDDSQKHPGSWISGTMLFLYAVPFSFAYVSLNTGIGALILFGSVQATMILVGLLKGERPHILEWCGLLVALSGLVYLVLPGLEAPSLLGALLMTTAGVSWGIYSLRGFNVTNPTAVTGDNFLRAVPPVIVISLLMVTKLNLSLNGIFLAFLSGALTSGIGYVLWYAALQVLSATRAATVQLLVPIIAALGGILILSEPITLRLVFSGIMIIGGVGTTLAFRNK